MKTSEDNILTMQIGGKAGAVSLRTLINLFEDMLIILKDLDSRLSGTGEMTLRWEITEARLNSPLVMTITGRPIHPGRYSRGVAVAYMNGMRRLERGTDPPPFFSTKSIQKAKKLASTAENGVSPLTFSSPGSDPVEPSEHLAENAESILKRTFYFTDTTLEGQLETLDVHGRYSFVIYDTLTKHPVKCIFQEEMFDQVVLAVRHRVAVTGIAKFNRRTGRPVSIRLKSLRKFRTSTKLPQFRAGEEIDITGGIESAEFVRRVRDAE